MISRFGVLERAAGLSGDFDRHWLEAHGPPAASFPGLRDYWRLVVDSAHFRIDHACGPWRLDGFSELHFDDIDSMSAAVASIELMGPSR